jgi:hypothetical protein
MQTHGTQFKGTMLQLYGGQTLLGAPKQTTSRTEHGDISLTFTSATTATMTWPGGTKMLSRFPIAGGAVVEPDAGMPTRGWYVGSGEGGRGWMLEVQGNQIFFAGFMYDDSGYPIWYVSSGTMIGNIGYVGNLSLYGGGQTYTSPWIAPGAVRTNPNLGRIIVSNTPTGLVLELPNQSTVSLLPFRFY